MVPGAASRCQEPFRRRASVAKDVRGIGDGERHPLQDGARHLALSMIAGKAEETTARIGVVMRRALARKIGMEHQVRCRRVGFGKVPHQAVDIGTGDLAKP